MVAMGLAPSRLFLASDSPMRQRAEVGGAGGAGRGRAGRLAVDERAGAGQKSLSGSGR